MLKEGERLDDLQCKGLRIIQDKKGYTFTTDAVLLANFVRAYSGYKVIDLGTGSGVISVLLAGKTKAEITGVELQERLYDMARRSVALNNLEDRVKLINADMRAVHEITGREVFDVAVVNPPYMPFEGDKETATEIDICRREAAITLKEVIESAGRLLKYGGVLYIIIKGDRLADLMYYMKECGIEPKKITPVQPTPGKNIDTVIAEGKKGGKSGLVFSKPLIVFDKDGNYSEEARRLYNK